MGCLNSTTSSQRSPTKISDVNLQTSKKLPMKKREDMQKVSDIENDFPKNYQTKKDNLSADKGRE